MEENQIKLKSINKTVEVQQALDKIYEIAPWEYGVIIDYILSIRDDLEEINKSLNKLKR